MNKQKRKHLEKMIEQLGEIQSKLQDFKSEVEVLLEEEQACFDNLPEGLQGSSKGEDIQRCIDAIANADNNLEEAQTAVDDVVQELTEAVS